MHHNSFIYPKKLYKYTQKQMNIYSFYPFIFYYNSKLHKNLQIVKQIF